MPDDSAPTATRPDPSDLETELLLQQEELQQQNEELRRSHLVRARYEDLYDRAPVGYLTLDAHGVVREANLTLAAMLDAPREHVQGRRFAVFLAPGGREAFALVVARALQDGGRHAGETRLQRRDGGAFPARFECHALDDAPGADGAARFCLVALLDATAEHEAREELVRANESLERQVRERTRQLRDLAEHFQEFTLAAAEELAAPVRRVNAFLRLLRKDGVLFDERQVEHLGHVFRSAERADLLLRGLLEYARAGAMRAVVTPVDVNRVVTEVLKDLAPSMEGRAVQLVVEPLPTVPMDSRALQVVMTKLLENALKFTLPRETAVIRIGARETVDAHLLSVADNGVGFSMRQHDRLFSVFRRLHPEREFEGQGVGLPIVQQLCRRFGGRVWAEGEVGEGATFFVALPKTPSEVI